MNSRMEGLLRRLGLEARYTVAPSEWASALDANLDFDDVHERLNDWRSFSMDFLDRALAGIGE